MIIRKNSNNSNYGLLSENIDSYISHSNEEYIDTVIQTIQSELDDIGIGHVVIHDGKDSLKITVSNEQEIREYKVSHSDLSYKLDSAVSDGRAIVDEVFMDG